jgi:hypothetical protein
MSVHKHFALTYLIRVHPHNPPDLCSLKCEEQVEHGLNGSKRIYF